MVPGWWAQVGAEATVGSPVKEAQGPSSPDEVAAASRSPSRSPSASPSPLPSPGAVNASFVSAESREAWCQTAATATAATQAREPPSTTDATSQTILDASTQADLPPEGDTPEGSVVYVVPTAARRRKAAAAAAAAPKARRAPFRRVVVRAGEEAENVLCSIPTASPTRSAAPPPEAPVVSSPPPPSLIHQHTATPSFSPRPNQAVF